MFSSVVLACIPLSAVAASIIQSYLLFYHLLTHVAQLEVAGVRLRCCYPTWVLPSSHTSSESKLLLSCHIPKAPGSNLWRHASLRKKAEKDDFQTKLLRTQEKHKEKEAVGVLTQAAIPLLEATGYGVEMALVNAGRDIPNLTGLSVKFTCMIWVNVYIFDRNPVFSCFWAWKFWNRFKMNCSKLWKQQQLCMCISAPCAACEKRTGAAWWRPNHSVSSRHVTGHNWAHQPRQRYLSESTFQKDQNTPAQTSAGEGEKKVKERKWEKVESTPWADWDAPWWSRYTLQPVGCPHTGASVYFLVEIQSMKSPNWSMKNSDEERVTLRNTHILTIIPSLTIVCEPFDVGEVGSAAGKLELRKETRCLLLFLS